MMVGSSTPMEMSPDPQCPIKGPLITCASDQDCSAPWLAAQLSATTAGALWRHVCAHVLFGGAAADPVQGADRPPRTGYPGCGRPVSGR
jgi:hypothetical protein